MTSQQAAALCRGIQYLITELTDVPKTTAGKAKRTEVIQALKNAARPEVAAAVDLERRRENAAVDVPAAPGQSSIKLEVSMMLPPDDEQSMVRPGTVAGLPVGGEAPPE